MQVERSRAAAAPRAIGRPGVLLLCDECSATATAPTATATPAATAPTASPCDFRDCRSARPARRPDPGRAGGICPARDGAATATPTGAPAPLPIADDTPAVTAPPTTAARPALAS